MTALSSPPPVSTVSMSEADPRRVQRSVARKLVSSGATLVFVIDLLLVAAFTFFSTGHVFWSIANLQALLRNGTEILLLSLGVAILMGAGVFDLSVGANLVLSSVLAGLAMAALNAGGAPAAAIFAAGIGVGVVAGAAFGAVNGLVITKLKVNSLIATLGTLGIGSGAALLLTNGQDVRDQPEFLQSYFVLAQVALIPAPMICALVVLAFVWFLLRFTRFGMRTLAIGSNPIAAERAGIDKDAHIILLASLAGSIAGFAGFVDVARLGATAISSHQLDGLSAATAVVIGGTALSGGRVSVLGALFGAALSIMLLSGLIIIRVQPFWQLVATGSVLIAAVAFDQFRARQIEQ
jgi:ribose transport system permease protein